MPNLRMHTSASPEAPVKLGYGALGVWYDKNNNQCHLYFGDHNNNAVAVLSDRDELITEYKQSIPAPYRSGSIIPVVPDSNSSKFTPLKPTSMDEDDANAIVTSGDGTTKRIEWRLSLGNIVTSNTFQVGVANTLSLAATNGKNNTSIVTSPNATPSREIVRAVLAILNQCAGDDLKSFSIDKGNLVWDCGT